MARRDDIDKVSNEVNADRRRPQTAQAANQSPRLKSDGRRVLGFQTLAIVGNASNVSDNHFGSEDCSDSQLWLSPTFHRANAADACFPAKHSESFTVADETEHAERTAERPAPQPSVTGQ